jgi:hypothetical protein
MFRGFPMTSPIPNRGYRQASKEYSVTVLNGTALLLSRCHDASMLHKKARQEPGKPIRASVTMEMATLRMARSTGQNVEDVSLVWYWPREKTR